VLACPFCGRGYKYVAWLKVHARARHIVGNRCPVCGEEFLSDDALMKHLAMKGRRCERHLVVWYLAKESRKRGLRHHEMSRKALELLRRGLRL